ncbi:MAG: CHASE2 domain-containing protein [Bacillota bacterium]
MGEITFSQHMRWVIRAIIVALLIMFVFSFNWLDNLELLTYDYRMILNSQFHRNPQQDIVVVTIDDQSVAELGSWPWPRKHHAQLISKVNQAGAKAVAFDVLFEVSKPGDDILKETLQEAENVVLPYQLKLTAQRNIFDFSDTSYQIENINYPISKFKTEAAGLGYLNLLADHDGTIRRVHLLNNDNHKEQLQPFSFSIAKQHHENDKEFKQQQLLINFKVQENYFPQISYKQVLNNKFPADFFKDKLVLVGAKGNSFQDYLTTPVAAIKGYLPGVMIHAAIINNYLEDSFIKQLNSIQVLAFLLLCSLLSAGLYYKLTPLYSLITSVLIILGLIIINLIFFIAYNIFIPLLPFLLVVIINLIISLVIWYLKVEQRKNKLKDIFSRYLAPEVIKEVLELSEENYLEGKRKEITVLFLDITSFTTFAENHSSQEVVELLNNYFSLITAETFKFNGTLDKFLGDGVMVFFNAPTTQPKHAKKAVELAVELQNKITADSDLPLSVSIGINTGTAVVGNIGSTTRSDYTAIGDVVNTASRIEEITPPNEIYIGEATYQQVKNSYQVQLKTEAILRDKSNSENVYKLII